MEELTSKKPLKRRYQAKQTVVHSINSACIMSQQVTNKVMLQ